MALRAIFRFENLDNTSDLNSLYDGLFKKGVYEGGSLIQSSNTSITVSAFKAVSDDGMHIISDSDVTLSIPSSGIKYFVVCKAKYVYDDSPIISLSLKTEASLSADAEENYYIKLGSVTLNGVSASINLNDDKDELSVLGRNPYKGIFDDAATLASATSGKCQKGDWAVVSAGNSSEEMIQIYIYSEESWNGLGNAKVLETSYGQHVNNAGSENISVVHNVPTASEMEGNEDKGAFHISYNQLASIPSGVSSENKLVASDDAHLLSADQINALKGNYGTPSDINRFVTAKTPIATFTNVSATMQAGNAYIKISLPASTPGYFLGKGIQGTAQYYFEIRNSDNTDVLYANEKPVVACGVYSGTANGETWNIGSEIIPANYASSSYYWYESSGESSYLFIKTGDIEGSAGASDMSAGTCSVNLYCGTDLGSIDGDATSQRIYKQGLRQFSVVTFEEAICGNLKIQNNSLTISYDFASLSLDDTGLVYSLFTGRSSGKVYKITPTEISSYNESTSDIYTKFYYSSGVLNIESSSTSNTHTTLIIDNTSSSNHGISYTEIISGSAYVTSLSNGTFTQTHNEKSNSISAGSITISSGDTTSSTYSKLECIINTGLSSLNIVSKTSGYIAGSSLTDGKITLYRQSLASIYSIYGYDGITIGNIYDPEKTEQEPTVYLKATDERLSLTGSLGTTDIFSYRVQVSSDGSHYSSLNCSSLNITSGDDYSNIAYDTWYLYNSASGITKSSQIQPSYIHLEKSGSGTGETATLTENYIEINGIAAYVSISGTDDSYYINLGKDSTSGITGHLRITDTEAGTNTTGTAHLYVTDSSYTSNPKGSSLLLQNSTDINGSTIRNSLALNAISGNRTISEGASISEWKEIINSTNWWNYPDSSTPESKSFTVSFDTRNGAYAIRASQSQLEIYGGAGGLFLSSGSSLTDTVISGYNVNINSTDTRSGHGTNLNGNTNFNGKLRLSFTTDLSIGSVLAISGNTDLSALTYAAGYAAGDIVIVVNTSAGTLSISTLPCIDGASQNDPLGKYRAMLYICTGRDSTQGLCALSPSYFGA